MRRVGARFLALPQNLCKLHRISLYDTYFVLLRILVNHALLYSVLGYTADGFGKACKTIYAGNQYVPMIFKPVQDLQPVFCAFIFADAHSEYVLLPPITQLTIKLRFKSVFGNFAYHPLKKRAQVMHIVNLKRNDKNSLSLSFLSCFAARTSGLSLYLGMVIPPNYYFYDTPFRRFTQDLKRSRDICPRLFENKCY